MVDLEFYRGKEWGREARKLNGAIYNRAHSLLVRAGTGQLFVPIRSMQYLAILGEEEFVFVDGMGARTIELAWQHFRVSERQSINDPVSYEWVAYEARAQETMQRLPIAFERALIELGRKDRTEGKAVILPLRQ